MSEIDDYETLSTEVDSTPLDSTPLEECIITIPLHPCLRPPGDIIITEENKTTFIQTKENVHTSVIEWGPSIAYVNKEFITYDLCKIAIESASSAIGSINPTHLTKEEYYNLCLESVKESGWNIQYLPKRIQTQEIVDTAIKGACWAIEYALDEFKTYENCLAAVKRNGQTLQHVPNNFITKEMCELAVRARYPCLNLIPKEFLTKDLCTTAVKGNGRDIANVPDEFMSSELGFIAITSPAPSNPSSDMAGENIKYIPAKYITREIILESTKRWSSTYVTIPKECITEEIEDAVLEVSPYCIKHMKQTPERCLRAIKTDYYIIEDINREHITKEMAEYIVSLPDNIKSTLYRDVVKYLESMI